jgi:1,4-alpha-glucan branching enzyme
LAHQFGKEPDVTRVAETLIALSGSQDHGDGIVTFALYAPGKKSVRLAGSFNGWDASKCPMEDRNGYFVTQLQLPAGPAEYQYVLDDSIVICDPY